MVDSLAEPLTPGERRILEQVLLFKDNDEIQRDLGLKSRTVKNYISRIYAKYRVMSRLQLLRTIYKVETMERRDEQQETESSS